jgi:hypothetical protein
MVPVREYPVAWRCILLKKFLYGNIGFERYPLTNR